MGEDGVYRGEIKNGIPDGKGELLCDTVTRSGTWVNGVLMDGRTHWQNGNKFVGIFYENGNEMEGKYTFADSGIEFDGTFDEEGNFEHGMMKNMGPDGSIWYEGHFLNNKRHGEGVFFGGGETFYIGNFVNDNPEGEGTMIEPNIKASGIWKDDHLDGTLTYNNGTTCGFVGTINSIDGKTVGDGKMTMPSGVVYDGHFEDNMPIQCGKISWPGIAVKLPMFSHERWQHFLPVQQDQPAQPDQSFCIVTPSQYTRLMSANVIEPQQDPLTLEDIDSIKTDHLLHFELKLDKLEPIKLWHPVNAALMVGNLKRCAQCRLNYPYDLRTWIQTRLMKRMIKKHAATKIQRFVRSKRHGGTKRSGTKRSGTKRSGTKRSGTKHKNKRTSRQKI